MRAFLVPNKRPGSKIDSMYSLPLSGLGEEELNDEKRRLTLQAKSTFGAPAPPFAVYKIDNERLYVPRFYGLTRFGPAEVDERVEGAPIQLVFNASLRDVQDRALQTVEKSYFNADGPGGAMTVLPCGFGKTVLAVALTARLGRKAAVLVHTSVLKTQWKESFETFCPGVRVGYVQGNTFDVADKDVVIMMLQTVAKRQFAFDVTDEFGLLICDEAHHMAAPLMNQAFRCFRARRVLALTATKERADGLTRLLHWCMGEEAFRAERKSQHVTVKLIKFPGAVEKHTKDGRPLVAIMLNLLAADCARNRFLTDRVVECYRQGRVIIFLSHRTAQLRAIYAYLTSDLHKVPKEDVGMLEAAQKEDARAVQMERSILLCTYNMADEGMDKKTLDTAILGTPKSRVEQCIGRIQRDCDTKQSPLVYDIADEGLYYSRLRSARQTFYRKNSHPVEMMDWETFASPPSSESHLESVALQE